MIEVHSETWRVIQGWAEEKMEEAARHCLIVNVDERKADHFRGRASIIQELIQLPQEPQDG